MAARLLVHAGFHKTGTTSIQKTLGHNRAALAPFAKVILREDMEALCEAARAFSIRPGAMERSMLIYEAAQVFEALDPEDGRTVLMSSEDLSGHMPGRHGLTSYRAAEKIMPVLREVALECLPGAGIGFWFTTRSRRPWLASCYAQNVRASRMVQSLEEFTAMIGQGADLKNQVRRIARVVAPSVVGFNTLESIADVAFGPAETLLGRAGVTIAARQRMKAVPWENRSLPPEILAEMLAINRSDLDDRAVRDAKKTVIDRYDRQKAGA
ncbi:hypothetical protein ACRARG_13060 [Pseudooceanicola sp. C21-150M6]|uniref:hypothetical protein n=1 Tax=Pseudooceanicola sp. C21-150M6 TaxID=3434355 RepID=UPI003D7F9462